MPHHLTPLEFGAAAAGVSARAPQLIVHQATLALRQLFDSGASQEDPRCLALLQLINAARLQLLPNSNNGAKLANDLSSKAVHIDVSTATMAALMSLNAANLMGAAVAEASRGLAKPMVPSTPGKPLTLKLLPRPAQKATDALFALVRTDDNLGERARNEAQFKSSSMATKLHKLRAGQRHANLRKRRLAGEGGPDSPAELAEAPLPLSQPPPGFQPTRQYQPPSENQTPPGQLEQVEAPVALDEPRYILPRRRNLVYSNPVPLPMQHVSPPNIPPSVYRRDPRSVRENDSFEESGNNLVAAGFPRIRAAEDAAPQSLAPSSHVQGPQVVHQPVLPQQVTYPVSHVSATDKGVMNDTIGTPTDIMEAFMHPQGKDYGALAEASDNATKIRSVLAERERILYRLVRRRQSELAAMPLGMTEQTRRKAIIEAKQLSLLDLQRVARYRVSAEMKKTYSLAIQEDRAVPADHLSRLFRRRDPPIYSYTDGYPRITPFDGMPEMKPRPPAVVAQDSVRMAQFDMSRMVNQKAQRQREFNAKFIRHHENFQNFAGYVRNSRARMWKGFERHFLDLKRVEEKKRKLERIERLRLLRSNDEQAYLNLLKDTKNERLLQLVRQTDSYLMQIGASVEKAREHVTIIPGDEAHNAFTEELGDQDQVPIDAMRRRRDLYYTVTHSVQEEVCQPSMMVHGTLKPYQVEGLKWMVSLYNNNLNGILADEMGLGKTIQTISLITYLVERKKNPGPYLIIVPLSTMGNWLRELDLWAPSLVKIAYRGDRNTRRAIQQRDMARSEFSVVLTTYEFTVKDQAVLGRISWQYIIIDEGHRMKNANCKLAMTLGVKYRSRNRLLLTGTPLQNNLTELWALLNFLLPTIFSSSDTFETWFKQPFESTTLGDTAELEEEETLLVINRLHQVLRPFLLRRLKTDVESQLPEKVEHVIRCDLSTWQRVLYRQVQNRIGLATGSHNGSTKAYNNLLMQCKKICNHPYLFYDAEAILDLPQDYLIRASGKFFLLHHMLPKLQSHGHRTLIFSQMTAALDYLEDFLIAIGMQYMRLDGNTKADDRQELLNRFNEKDSPYFCFLLSTRAGGLGLNLQTADTVIIFDSDWNPMMDLQAQDRAHRIGQTKVVRVYRLICSGTVEVKILDQANRKLQVDAQVIQAGQFNNKSTELDRHQMLKSMLRQKDDDEDEVGVVPDMEELNRLFARSDEEFEAFRKYDEKSRATDAYKPLFVDESELPEWVLQPDVDHKTPEEKQREILSSHGRGRRLRKSAQRDMDALTETEWLKVMEGEMTMEEAYEKRKKRFSAIADRKASAEGNPSSATRTELAPNVGSGEVETGLEDGELSGQAQKEIGEDTRGSEADNESVTGSQAGEDSSVTGQLGAVAEESQESNAVTRKSSRVKTPSAIRKASDAQRPKPEVPLNGAVHGDVPSSAIKRKRRNGKLPVQNLNDEGAALVQTVPLVRIRLNMESHGDDTPRVVEEKSVGSEAEPSAGARRVKRKPSTAEVGNHESGGVEKRPRKSTELSGEDSTEREGPMNSSNDGGSQEVGYGARALDDPDRNHSTLKRTRASSTEANGDSVADHSSRKSMRKRRKALNERQHEEDVGTLELGADVPSNNSRNGFADDADELGFESDPPSQSVLLKLRVKEEGRRRRNRVVT